VLCTTKSDTYPVLQNAVEQASDLIHFVKLIILNLMNKVRES